MSDVARTPGRRRALPGDLARRCCSAPRSSCATWPRWAATCASARAARTCATASRPATSASRARGCAALDGLNRGHAILGTSEHCIATHPSDVAVALVAFDAVVAHGRPGRRARRSPIDDFFLLPGDTPEREHPLAHGELIVAIEVPAAPVARRSVYLKFRDRQSYEFALVSVAAALEVSDGVDRRRAARARRRGHEAVARAPGRGRAGRRRRRTTASFRRAAAAELEAAVVARAQRVQGRARRPRGRRARGCAEALR